MTDVQPLNVVSIKECTTYNCSMSKRYMGKTHITVYYVIMIVNICTCIQLEDVILMS